MAETKQKSRMFTCVTHTHNLIVGCQHGCPYCWARKLAERGKYKFDEPRLLEGHLGKKFPKGSIVFLNDMCDIFSPGVNPNWISLTIEFMSTQLDVTFLVMSKNPKMFAKHTWPQNAILGTTIETNCAYIAGNVNKPNPGQRGKQMVIYRRANPSRRLFVSIEPIIMFTNPQQFAAQIAEIKPWKVAVGYDNHYFKLNEPKLEDTKELIRLLREKYGIDVMEKTLRERVKPEDEEPQRRSWV